MSKCIWLTGLPCSGKTTIAKQLEKHFARCQILDGDEIRNTPLGLDVGFSLEARNKHILRMGFLAKMFVDQEITTICSFISPNEEIRNKVREFFGKDQFFEVFVDASLDECIKRDVKGMYKKALAGEIADFTGVSSKYDIPTNPDLIVNTESSSLDECVNLILSKTTSTANRKALFIGRWNGVYHNGHDYIIQQKLNQGKEVLMAIRDVKPDEKNPWTAKQVKKMLDYRWKDNPKVSVIIIPDIESVEYGRDVGYQVNEIKVDREVAGISGTKCREMIKSGDPGWKDFVPSEVVEFLEGESN